MRPDDLYLAEILDAADLIAQRVEGVDDVSWNADDRETGCRPLPADDHW